MPLWRQAVEQNKQIHCAFSVLRDFQPWPGEVQKYGLTSELTSCEQEFGPETSQAHSQSELSCDSDPALQTGYLKPLSLFAFSEFWSQLNSRIKGTMVRKSCEIVLSVSALRSEHYDKEHDAGGDSFESPIWSSLFLQATSWQAIALLQSRIKERRKLGSWFG